MTELDVKKGSQEQRGSLQQRGRSSYDPFGFSLIPSEMFGLNPFSLVRRVSEEVERAVRSEGSFGRSGAWAPQIEVLERDGKYIVHADLPGLKQENVKVEVTDNVLTLQGERRSENEEKNGGVYRSERHYGQFFRSIPLPEGADIDRAKAQFHDGVLEVAIPVPEGKNNRRQIPIEAGQGKSAQANWEGGGRR